MNILITGVNGFVGTSFTSAWSALYNLYGVAQINLVKEGVNHVWKWNELNSIVGMDAIIHLAGKAHDIKNSNADEIYFEVNTDLTKKIFDYFLNSECKTFVFFSSVKAVADFVSGDVLEEDVEPHPIGPYGESKIRAENYIIDNMALAESRGKKVYILRPCMIHGPGNKGNLNLLYKVVNARIPWPLGAFENRRSFCSIRNITYVVEQLLIRTDIDSGIYNVCDDEALSTNELIGLIGNAIVRDPILLKLPKRLIECIANLGDVLHLPLTNERLMKLTENYVVSNEKIKKALGIESMPVTAKQGIYYTINSFL